MGDFFKRVWEDKFMRSVIKIFLVLVMASILYLLGRLIYKSHAGEAVDTPIWKEQAKQVPDTGRGNIFKNDTIENVTFPSKHPPVLKPQQEKIKSEEETPNIQNNGGVKNQNNGINNGIVGDVTADIADPVISSKLISKNLPKDDKYITLWEFTTDYKGAIDVIAFNIYGAFITDIEVSNGLSMVQTGIRQVRDSIGYIELLNPTKKTYLQVTTSKPDKVIFEISIQ